MKYPLRIRMHRALLPWLDTISIRHHNKCRGLMARRLALHIRCFLNDWWMSQR